MDKVFNYLIVIGFVVSSAFSLFGNIDFAIYGVLSLILAVLVDIRNNTSKNELKIK